MAVTAKGLVLAAMFAITLLGGYVALAASVRKRGAIFSAPRYLLPALLLWVALFILVGFLL